jgi:5'-methylthioadenosine phosphorylase
MATLSAQIAVIGGSGLYNMPEITNVQDYNTNTPFGMPSDTIRVGTLDGAQVAFLPRHGRNHTFTPTEVPYRANIYALKTLGVRHIISVSACGSLREDYAPGHVVTPDQLYDNTKSDRGRSFFEAGLVAHANVADPFCPDLSALIADSVIEAGGTAHRQGTFVTIEGPRFSTKAESRVYRQLGFDIVGMTAAPEAFLAREAEMCYAAMAHITDYDVWHQSEAPVTVEAVMKQFSTNIALAQRAVLLVVKKLAGQTAPCQAENAMQGAFATSPEKVRADDIERLRPLIGKYFPEKASS